MLFLSLIPIVGAIWIFILMVRNSNSGDNKYGLNPQIKIEPLIVSSPVVEPTPTEIQK